MNTYLSASPFQETSYQTQKWVMYKNMKRHLNMYYLRAHHEKKDAQIICIAIHREGDIKHT